jgi:hypothetical protein
MNDGNTDTAMLVFRQQLRERREAAWRESERLARLADTLGFAYEDAFNIALDRAIEISRTYNAMLAYPESALADGKEN